MMWGRIGRVFSDKPRTAEEAIVEGGLDWNVELRDLGFKRSDGKSFKRVVDQYVTVRSDTEEALGTVKSRYQTFNNREAFSFADNLVDGAGASFESAWEQNGGKVVGLTMKLPNSITVAGEDQFDQYLMLRTSHDGSSSIQLALSNMRMMCLNQFNANLRNAERRWTVAHSTSAPAKLGAAREALEIAFAYNDEFEREMEKLIQTEVTQAKAAGELRRLLTTQRCSEKSTEVISDAILANWMNSPTIHDRDRNTAYGLINASTEYFDHLRDYRTPDAAVKVTTEGLGARINQALMDELVAA